MNAAELSLFYSCRTKDEDKYYCAMFNINDAKKKFDDVVEFANHSLVKCNADSRYLEIPGVEFTYDEQTAIWMATSEGMTEPTEDWAAGLMFDVIDLNGDGSCQWNETLRYGTEESEEDTEYVALFAIVHFILLCDIMWHKNTCACHFLLGSSALFSAFFLFLYINLCNSFITWMTNYVQPLCPVHESNYTDLSAMYLELFGEPQTDLNYTKEQANSALQSGCQIIQTEHIIADISMDDDYVFNLGCTGVAHVEYRYVIIQCVYILEWTSVDWCVLDV